ncbi:hypothetical protein ACET3Z_001401 [Daucus carota]
MAYTVKLCKRHDLEFHMGKTCVVPTSQDLWAANPDNSYPIESITFSAFCETLLKMAAYNNVIILMLASLLLRSVVSDSPAPSPFSPVPQPPSSVDSPAPSPGDKAPVPAVKTPAPAPGPGPVQHLAPTPAESPKASAPGAQSPEPSPSIWTPPAEAPAPESNDGVKRVAGGLVCFGAFVVGFMA